MKPFWIGLTKTLDFGMFIKCFNFNFNLKGESKRNVLFAVGVTSSLMVIDAHSDAFKRKYLIDHHGNSYVIPV